MINIQSLVKTYQMGETRVEALRGIDLMITAGEFVAVSGASGSGKSTLLNIIGTIERPTSGRVEIEGSDTGELTSDQASELRARRLGFVFQTFNLLPVLTAFENVEYPLRLQQVSTHERRERVRAILAEVGLSAFLNHRPGQLSGGQRQRVAIARALVGGPAVLLADEPTANLDRQTGLEIIAMMKDLQKKRGTTLLVATHDPNITERADRVIRLQDGQVI